MKSNINTNINTLENTIEQTFLALGTINVIKIYDSDDVTILEQAIHRVNEIEARMSAFKIDSDISQIRKNAGMGYTEVNRETYEIIKRAVDFSKLTNGYFDITMKPIIELWGINSKDNFIPSQSEVEEKLKLVDYEDILFDDENNSIALVRLGQSIDLGGIAKGYAADEVKRILMENGVKSALINLGGNVITIGNKPDGQEWKVGIQNPTAPTGEYLGVLSVSDKTIVTSGSNERFFMKDGIRYHHILDPKTGFPAQSDLLSVTVVGKSSIEADAITTALFILGPEASMELLSKFDLDYIFIKNDMSIIISNRLADQFQLVE